MKEKTSRNCFGAFWAVIIALLFLLQSRVVVANAETYKHEASGLEKEFEPFLKAYQKGDDKGMDAAFGVFRLPKAKEWFASYFSAEDAATLSAAYDTEVNGGETSLIESMNLADTGSRFHARCELREDSGAGQAKGGVQALKVVPVEQFLMEFQSTKNGQKFRFIANFVYVDGAYRFEGGGGAPFWGRPK